MRIVQKLFAVVLLLAGIVAGSPALPAQAVELAESSRTLSMERNLAAPTDEFIKSLAEKQNLSYTVGKEGVERFYADDGTPIYPPNDGAVGDISKMILAADREILTRYGSEFGRYVSPGDIAFTARALPRSTDQKNFHRYRVLADIPNVEVGKIAPWFGEEGGGIQYKLPARIRDLIDTGYLEEVKDEEKSL